MFESFHALVRVQVPHLKKKKKKKNTSEKLFLVVFFQIWDFVSGTCLKTLEGHKGTIWSLCMIGNGQFASGSSDEKIKVKK